MTTFVCTGGRWRLHRGEPPAFGAIFTIAGDHSDLLATLAGGTLAVTRVVAHARAALRCAMARAMMGRVATMTVTKALSVESFVLDDAAVAPPEELFWCHVFTARRYDHPHGRIETVFHCPACGQVRPYSRKYGTRLVERGMCPAQLDRPMPPEWGTIRALQARLRALDELVYVARAVLAAQDRGRFVLLDGVILEQLRRIVDAVEDARVPAD